MADTIDVEVVFAAADKQRLISVRLAEGACVADALAESGIELQFRDVDFSELPVGIWGRLADRGSVLKQGDRVEVYRPLEKDPREARREWAEAQRSGSSS